MNAKEFIKKEIFEKCLEDPYGIVIISREEPAYKKVADWLKAEGYLTEAEHPYGDFAYEITRAGRQKAKEKYGRIRG